jgi:tetratricopeptide (TPR) repeat protein
MERMLQDLHRAAAERGSQSDAELQQLLKELNQARGTHRPAGRLDPKAQAQELAYQAMEHPDHAESARLARAALRLDPECVDALATLAGLTVHSDGDLIARLEEVVATGARALGADFFAENRGRFWGILPTRPYMRTRAALADLLRQTGRLAEAIGNYEALLDLNPNDNQGNRDPLLGCYLAAGNLEGARRLLQDYAKAGWAVFAWGRVLERHLAGDLVGAASALEEARTKNRHVEAFLTAARPAPQETPAYYQPGQESEAVRAADFLLSDRPGQRGQPGFPAGKPCCPRWPQDHASTAT